MWFSWVCSQVVMEITKEQEQRLLEATEDFSRAMEIRNAMSLRVAMRVTSILRIGMVSLGLVTLILLLMLYAFTSKMDAMIDALETMNMEFSSMSEDMGLMRTTISGMERNISHVPAITLHGITGHVGNLTWQMRGIDPAVQHMGRDVNRMSGPMRMFNIINPMD